MGLNHLICVGASAGGISAIKVFLKALPHDFKIPIVFIQHMKSDSHINFQLVFGDSYLGESVEIKDKTPIESSKVYFSPANYHVLLEKDGSFSLSQDEPVCHSRPSIDVFFESTVLAMEGHRITGVVLTGANEDGAYGLSCIEKEGGNVFVQSPEEAEFPYMPEQAIKKTQKPKVLKINEIVEALSSALKEGLNE